MLFYSTVLRLQSYQLSVQTEELIGLIAPHSHKHHHLFEAKVKRQEKNISQLKAVFQNADPFCVNSESFQDGKKLFNIISKEIMQNQLKAVLYLLVKEVQLPLNSLLKRV